MTRVSTEGEDVFVVVLPVSLVNFVFSPDTMLRVAEATGVEVRAKYNNYSAHGDYGQHTSASCWSPVINIMRDPRWGRNQVGPVAVLRRG